MRASHQKAGGILYNHQCAKIEVKFANISFCAEKVSAKVSSRTMGTHVRYMDPESRIIYRNSTINVIKSSHCIRTR